MATLSLPEPVELAFLKHEPSTGADPSKLPLILGHGLFGNKESWGATPAKIAEQTKRTVFAVDLRNHGDSPRTDDLTISAMLSDTLNFVEKQGISKAAFAGHSLGGMLYSRFATLWNDKVESVIIIDIDPIKKVEEAGGGSKLVDAIVPLLNFVLGTIRSENIGDLEQARKRADELMQKPIEDKNLRNHLIESLVIREGKVDWRYNIAAITTSCSTLFGFDEIIPKFDQPALEIYGANSPAIKKENIPGILERIPNCKFVLIPDADHAVPFTHPERLIEEAVKFLGN